MIIQTEKERVLTSLSNQERQFTISSSPKAFAVLMEGLYSNKIVAIVRELTSNAYDAHVQAGLTIPFEVTAPTVLVPTFTIRDFGHSMDHDFVMRLYSSVFFSSKEDSNEQVGTFGLGSKSPFAYTDTFNLSTYIDGIERLYSCFLNPDRIPCIVQLAENLTDQPDGTQVSFDVSAKDLKDFDQAITQIIKAYWRYPPVIHNLTVKTPKPRRLDIIDVDEVLVFSSTNNFYSVGPKYFFSQGNVWYPVPNEFINKPSPTYTQLRIFEIPYNSNMMIVMEVPIGTFNVTPSRESISLDKFSIENINRYITTVQDKVKEKVKDVYTPCKTRLDYFRTYRKIRGCGISSNLIEFKFVSPYKPQSGAATTLSCNVLRVNDDRYYNASSSKWKEIPKEALKISELKPGYLYMPGQKANTWTAVTSVGSVSNFNRGKIRLFSGLERKLIRKATRLKDGLRRDYNNREMEFICFSEDLPRFVRILGLKPEQVFSISSLPDPGSPTPTKKNPTTTPPVPKRVWKSDEAFVVLVQYGYISAKDNFCATNYADGGQDRIAIGDIHSFWTYLYKHMNDVEKKLVGSLTIKSVNWDVYDSDDTSHLYNKVVKVLGEDKTIEIMLRHLDLFNVDVPLNYEQAGWGHNHPFRVFVPEILHIEGHVTNNVSYGHSSVSLNKCPFADLRGKAMKLAEQRKAELMAQKEAILGQYPMFQVRNREQLLKYLEELKCNTTSSTSSVPTP